jgi:hypothetical protein
MKDVGMSMWMSTEMKAQIDVKLGGHRWLRHCLWMFSFHIAYWGRNVDLKHISKAIEN